MVAKKILEFLKRNKEFTSKDFIKYMIQQGYSFGYARDRITELKYLGLIEFKARKGRTTIYESKIYEESQP